MQRLSRRSGVQAGQVRGASCFSAQVFPLVRRWTGRQTDRRRGRRAFTLAELLVCLGVAGLLMSLILPAIQQTRESARQMQCRNNLRQLGLACQEHVAAHGFFPPDLVHGRGIGNHLSVHYSLLPFVDQAELYRRIRFPEVGNNWGAEPPKSDFNSEWMFVTLAAC